MSTFSLPLNCFNDPDTVPHLGAVIQPDQWPFSELLVEPNEWDLSQGANFRIVTRLELIPTLPVLVEVTGKTARKRAGHWGLWTRIKVTFIHDGEPNTSTGGWMKIGELY